MFKMVKTSCFVIKKFNFREFDRVYTLYTEELGKISLLVRSARKIKSKLASNLENFDEVKINFIKGRIFNHLAGSNVFQRNNFILRDTDKITFTYSCLSLLDRLVKPDERDQNIFNLLKEVTGGINKSDLLSLPKIDIYFFWRLIDLLGYRPQLDGCALCGKIIKGQELLFNITDHIIICRACAGDGILVQEETLEKLRNIFKLNLDQFLNFELDQVLLNITNKSKQIKLSEL